MSSLGLVLSIAKDALSAQRYGMNVTAHNIANVNTEGYSRQRAVFEPREPAPYGGVLLGRGVDTKEVVRLSDQFVENRLMQQGSSMLSFKEMENYMQVLEGVFSEDSEMSLSALLADFWNSWHDVTNNPSGASERIAVYDHSVSLSGQFNSLYADLTQLGIDLTNATSAGIGKINEITVEIAQINNEIVKIEAGKIANDLRDQRNMLISELSEYLDVKTFEQSNGSLTVITARGCVLVSGNDSYDLELGGDDGNKVLWQGSGGTTTDITDYLTNGKLGGWLDIRDEVIAKYKLDLDALAKEFIWTVNQQHSQGVGLEGFSTVTGTYRASDTTSTLDSSGLSFADKIVDGGFRLWVYDANGDYVSDTTITIDADVTQIDNGVAGDIVTQISNIANITATTTDGKLQISASGNCTFAFSDDTSNVLAAIGINTFFTNSTAAGIGVNDKIDDNKDHIAAAQVINNVGPAVAGSANTGTGTIVTSGHYTGAADATYIIEILNTGTETTATFQWSDDGGVTWTGPIVANYPNAQAIDVDGVSVTFMPGTYVANDTFTIDVTADSAFYGTYATGDNTNALAITDLQYTDIDIAQWTCDRRNGNTQSTVNATFEVYYHAMVGSMGIKSASVSRGRAFNEAMFSKLGEIRDSLSAVSLDEEMTNLIKFQYAYQAAAKLISVSDELLNTLLSVK